MSGYLMENGNGDQDVSDVAWGKIEVNVISHHLVRDEFVWGWTRGRIGVLWGLPQVIKYSDRHMTVAHFPTTNRVRWWPSWQIRCLTPTKGRPMTVIVTICITIIITIIILIIPTDIGAFIRRPNPSICRDTSPEGTRTTARGLSVLTLWRRPAR